MLSKDRVGPSVFSAVSALFAMVTPPDRSVKRWNSACTRLARSPLSRSVAAIISSIMAPDRPSPASGATSRASTRTCRQWTWAFQIRATIRAVASAASPAAVPVSGSSRRR